MHKNGETLKTPQGSLFSFPLKEMLSGQVRMDLFGGVGGSAGLLVGITFVGLLSLFLMLQSLNAMELWGAMLSDSKAAIIIFCIYALFFAYFIFVLFFAPWVLVNGLLISLKHKNRSFKSKSRKSLEALKMNIFILPISLSVCFLGATYFNFLNGKVGFVLCIATALSISPLARYLLNGHFKRLPVKCVFFYYEGDSWGCFKIWLLKVLLIAIWIVVFYIFLLLPGNDVNGIVQALISAVIWGGYLWVILNQHHRLSNLKERFTLVAIVGFILIVVVMLFSGKSLSYGLYQKIGFIQTEGNARTYQISQEFFNKQQKIEDLAARLYMQEQYAKLHIAKFVNHQEVRVFQSVTFLLAAKAFEVTGFSQYGYISRNLIKGQRVNALESRDDGIANIKKQLESPFKAYLGWNFGDKVVLCASEKLWLNCRSINSSSAIMTNLSSGLLIDRKFFEVLPEVPYITR